MLSDSLSTAEVVERLQRREYKPGWELWVQVWSPPAVPESGWVGPPVVPVVKLSVSAHVAVPSPEGVVMRRLTFEQVVPRRMSAAQLDVWVLRVLLVVEEQVACLWLRDVHRVGGVTRRLELFRQDPRRPGGLDWLGEGLS